MKPLATLDAETLPIRRRPDYPPKPVGFALREPGNGSKYYAWGHPSKNNCTFADAKKVIKRVYRDYRIAMHNAKFDLEVFAKAFGLPLEPRHGFEDSMLLAFLNNPREPDLKLKQLAIRHLGIDPHEQDLLKEWLCDNVKGAKQKKTKWGELIYLAPGDLVGRYAKGDTFRTDKLVKKFLPAIKQQGMAEQYDIEKRIILKAIKIEQPGIRIDHQALEPALKKVKAKSTRAQNKMFKIVGDINFNSPKQIVEAFNKKNLVKEWEYTDKGNEKTGIESLMRVCTDKELVKNLDTFSKCNKITGTYMVPWLESAQNNKGVFYPWFNTIRSADDKGTYTGRFSSNFQQVPREPKDKGYPFLRNFIMPDKKNHLLFNRDFMAQEIRILAHFEDGTLLVAFINNPLLDPHKHIGSLMEEQTGVDYGRPVIKTCNFLIIYGGGAKALSNTLNIPFNKAKSILTAHGNAIPGVDELRVELRNLSYKGEKFKTAGGRWYTFEEGYEYIALNTLIQGSAADHSKRALLNIDDMIEAQGYDARVTLQVHDEFMTSAPKRQRKKFMRDFKVAMEVNTLFDCQMLTDGKIGERWGTMEAVT